MGRFTSTKQSSTALPPWNWLQHKPRKTLRTRMVMHRKNCTTIESRARTAAICKKACFRGPTGCMPGRVRSDSSCVRGARVRRGCAAGAWAASWVRGGGAWRRGWAAYVGREPLTVAREHVGVVRAVAWGAGRRGVFPQCGVEHAWALGLLRRPVALSGLLLWWPSRAL